MYRRQLNTTTGLYEKIDGTQTDWTAQLTGTTLSGMVLQAGTEPASGYAADGNTVVLAGPTAQWADDLIETLLTLFNQDQSLRAGPIQTALGLGASSLNGWVALGFAPNTVTARGNHIYDLVFNGQDLTSTLSASMRLRTTRTAAAPTKCTLLNGTTQYYTKSSPAGMTATDNITVMAWMKLTSYNGASNIFCARKNGSTDGWFAMVDSSGRLQISGARAADDVAVSYQSVPVNKWTHVALTINSAGAVSTMYIDGVSVAVNFTNNANSGFLTPTGTFSIGADSAGGSPFNGKLAQVAVFSAVLSQSTIQSYMSQTLAGTETSLISAYSFNNTINDLNTTNTNNLTANGAAVATNADSFCGGQADGTTSSTLDYCEITSVTFSTNTTVTVRATNVNTIPTSGGVASVVYSSNFAPFGFPGMSKVLGSAQLGAAFAGTATSFTAVSGLATTVVVPTGGKDLKITFSGSCNASAGAGNNWTLDIYDSTNSVEVGSSNLVSIPTSGFSEDGTFVVYVPAPAAGTHTYQVRYTQSGAGTFTINASATGPATLTVESCQ